MTLLSERVQIDDELNVLTIDGFQFHGDLLSSMLAVTPPGRWYRVKSAQDGVLVCEQKYEEAPDEA